MVVLGQFRPELQRWMLNVLLGVKSVDHSCGTLRFSVCSEVA